MPRRKPTRRKIAIVSPATTAAQSKQWAWVSAAVLALLIGIVYVPAAKAPFIFDDLTAIVQNDSIVSLWPLIGLTKPGPLNPAPEYPTSGRPLVNLSFAVNYRFGGLNPI